MIWIILALLILIIIVGNIFVKKLFKKKGRESTDDIYPMY